MSTNFILKNKFQFWWISHEKIDDTLQILFIDSYEFIKIEDAI